MSDIRPFKAIRPREGKAASVASLPYDVMNRKEAAEMAKGNPDSFLHVVRAEIDLPDDVDIHAPEVYQKGKENLENFLSDGTMIQDESPRLYIYRQIMDGRVQTGLVACASVDEYLDGRIKKHELTLEAKEQDRIRHFDSCDANTAPIFLTYRQRDDVRHLINDYIKFHKPNAQFETEDQIIHMTWTIEEPDVIQAIIKAFQEVPALYIADGHHRCASSAKVGQKRRKEQPDAPADAEFNYFLAVIFPDEDLFIMDYNRLIKDLNGLSDEAFMEKLKGVFQIREVGDKAYRPMAKGHYGMYFNKRWYELTLKPEFTASDDPVESLDAQILQREVLQPILGIDDPRTSSRIDFVGGIRGLDELRRRVDEGDMRLAFALFPTSMDELLGVADAGRIMPPKSTWFEPKLRSGLFVHRLS